MRLNDPDIVAQVTRCADAYEEALARNDLSALDALFWNGPEVVRYGVGENLYGAQAIAAFRRARPGGSPRATCCGGILSAWMRQWLLSVWSSAALVARPSGGRCRHGSGGGRVAYSGCPCIHYGGQARNRALIINV